MTFTPTSYDAYDFANRRHIGPSPEEMQAMLAEIGAPSLDALIDQTVPKAIRQAEPLDFGDPLSESELLAKMREVADKNQVLTSLIGQGYHNTITPPAISRSASAMSTVWLVTACSMVVKAVTKMIWNSEVPITTLVGMPRR